MVFIKRMMNYYFLMEIVMVFDYYYLKASMKFYVNYQNNKEIVSIKVKIFALK